MSSSSPSPKYNQCRVTSEMLNQSCDLQHICCKYPFIRILPATSPSSKYRKLDWYQYNQKQSVIQFAKLLKKQKKSNQNQRNRSKPKKFDYLKWLRQQQQNLSSKLAIRDTNLCRIEKCDINGINCEWLRWEGSHIENGVIMIIHGGAYIMGSSAHKHQQCELISKLTACPCLLVNYSLAPEYPLPKCVDEIISVYKYLTDTLNVPAHKIAMEGESAGGGAILLAIQKMKHKLHLTMPCCVWVNSPWTDLSDSLPSKQRNSQFDAMLSYDKRRTASHLAVGNLDHLVKPTANQHDLQCATFSPLFGEWSDLCPIYFMCGATEILLDDTVAAAINAHEAGVSVKVDIDPYMVHAGPIFAYTPESVAANVRGCDWILHQFHSKQRLNPRARL